MTVFLAPVFLVLGLLSSAVTAVAQTPPGSGAEIARDTARANLTNGRGQAPLLDAPISRTEYILGPGDVLDIAILGDFNQVYSVQVTPEGSILIPSIGIVPVQNLNLDQAEVQVRRLLSRFYRNIDAKVALSQVRRFKVFVVGDVPSAGTQIASAATRVSEVIAEMRGSDPVRHRNIMLRRASGDTVHVDLARFYQTGDLSSNPTLREGDRLVVPVLDQTIQVFGRAHFPGKYEFRRGESLAELLSVANGGGGFPSNAADTIRLVRYESPTHRAFYQFSQEEALGPKGRAFPLQPFDAIYVAELANYKTEKAATVIGQVLRPGVYPIRPDTTTIRELITMAGGFTPRASLTSATLRRNPDSSSARYVEELKRVPTELLSPIERQILQIHTGGVGSAVLVDFRELFAAGEEVFNQTVQAGDTLSVPERRDEITIMGAVKNPGIVRYEPGMDVAYFLALAGGVTSQANQADIVVLKARLGQRVNWKDVSSLDPGDSIVVPYRERRNWMALLQGTNAVVGMITGLLLTVVAVSGVL